MSDRFSIEGLRYVNTVAQTASFSAAARSYGVTQPALSNGVAKLEEQLGSKLFDRTSRGVTPTAGAQILPLVERALDHIDAISAEAKRLTSAETRSIHVGVSRSSTRSSSLAHTRPCANYRNPGISFFAKPT